MLPILSSKKQSRQIAVTLVFSRTKINFDFVVGFPGMANVLNATVLTASGQPIQLTQGGPQKLIVTQQAGGQPRLIVPAQQVALLSNGGGSAASTPGGATITSATVTPLMAGNPELKKAENPGRQILQSLSYSSPLQLPSTVASMANHPNIAGLNSAQHHPDQRIETHKIISGPIGMSGTPIILQTALTTLP